MKFIEEFLGKERASTKLSEWAKKNCLSYRSAWRLFKEGKIPKSRRIPSGGIVIDDEPSSEQRPEYTVIYARINPSESREGLDAQAERLVQFCTAKGWVVKEVVKEQASGFSDKRPKLLKILTENKATRIVVERADRLSRFGFRYIQVLLSGSEIVVVNETETKNDILEDFVDLVMFFFAKLNNRRYPREFFRKFIHKLEEDTNKQRKWEESKC